MVVQGLAFSGAYEGLTTGRPILIGAGSAAAAAVLAGFFTPLGAAAGLAVSIAAFAAAQPGTEAGVTLAVTVLTAVAIALLGPGAYSVDARSFGRREIKVPGTKRR